MRGMHEERRGYDVCLYGKTSALLAPSPSHLTMSGRGLGNEANICRLHMLACICTALQCIYDVSVLDRLPYLIQHE